MEEELKKLNDEINRLQEQRQKIFDEQNKTKKEYFLKLEWTQNCSGILRVDSYGAAGLPKYNISIFGDVPTTVCMKTITLMGESDRYTENINYRGDTNPVIFTDNKDLLIEFILKAKFKNIEYDKNTLEVFNVLQSKY